MNNGLRMYNQKRREASRRKANARKHYGQTVVNVIDDKCRLIEKRYFADYSDATAFCDEVNAGKYIKGASAYTNY